MAEGGDEVHPKRLQFGNRFLTDSRNVFEHNAWDNVVWDAEQEATARSKVEESASVLVEPQLQEKYENEADKFWDDFYLQHQNRFFKDRHWLFTEFPELAPEGLPENIPHKMQTNSDVIDGESIQLVDKVATLNVSGGTCTENEGEQSTRDGILPHVGVVQSETVAKEIKYEQSSEVDPCFSELSQPISATQSTAASSSGGFPGAHGTTRILEVGCGVGNTVFPILQTNNDPGVFVYCCDLSPTAIQLVKEHADYTQQRCHAFVCDITDENAQVPFPDESLDIIILIFVLSAIHPDKMQATIHRLARFLKPGGLVVFRDYGRYDMAQLRFKKGRCLAENFYVRGDGTRVYFFTQDELRELFTESKLTEAQNLIDRRLQVNRGRQLKMYRVWIQCKYRKPLSPS